MIFLLQPNLYLELISFTVCLDYYSGKDFYGCKDVASQGGNIIVKMDKMCFVLVRKLGLKELLVVFCWNCLHN